VEAEERITSSAADLGGGAPRAHTAASEWPRVLVSIIDMGAEAREGLPPVPGLLDLGIGPDSGEQFSLSNLASTHHIIG